jgi:hypothetical protein
VKNASKPKAQSLCQRSAARPVCRFLFKKTCCVRRKKKLKFWKFWIFQARKIAGFEFFENLKCRFVPLFGRFVTAFERLASESRPPAKFLKTLI